MCAENANSANLKQGAYLALTRLRIHSGGIIPLVLLILGKWNPVMFAIGAALIVLGQSLRLCSAGILRKNEELSRSGPYALCRNPLYLGTILIQLGFGLLSGSWALALLAFTWFSLVYAWVILLEEKWLIRLFGEPYRDYLRTTPRLLPTVSSLEKMFAGCAFSWKQVKVNRELKSAAASVIGALLFLIKYAFALWSIPLSLW